MLFLLLQLTPLLKVVAFVAKLEEFDCISEKTTSRLRIIDELSILVRDRFLSLNERLRAAFGGRGVRLLQFWRPLADCDL